jgi:hypothetical protein
MMPAVLGLAAGAGVAAAGAWAAAAGAAAGLVGSAAAGLVGSAGLAAMAGAAVVPARPSVGGRRGRLAGAPQAARQGAQSERLAEEEPARETVSERQIAQ